MDDFDLPPELRDLERALAARRRPEPPAGLRDRVIGRAQVEQPAGAARGSWSFAVVMAGAALVWLNLSLSATLATDFGRGTRGSDMADRPSTAEIAQQIRRLLPELSDEPELAEEITRRQDILLRAASDRPR